MKTETETIILKIIAICADGGSYFLMDKEGNRYWQDNSFKTKKTVKSSGIIYIVGINKDKKNKKAKGSFKIEPWNTPNQINKIIKQ